MARSSRSWYAVWELLTPEQQAEMRALAGYPDDWRPAAERPREVLRRLEGLAEIKRFYHLRPGLITQWKDDLMDHVEGEGKE